MAPLSRTAVAGCVRKWVGFLVLLIGAVLLHPGSACSQAADQRRPSTDRYGDPLPPGALARLGTTRLHPGASVVYLACLPDRNSFLSVSNSEEGMAVCVWRTDNGRLVRRFESHHLGVLAVALSPDGKTLVTSEFIDLATGVQHVHFWDVASGKQTGEWKEAAIVPALAFAPDGKTLATAGFDQSLPVGKRLAISDFPPTLHLWNPETRTELRRFGGLDDMGDRLAFSPDGKVLASGSCYRETIKLWDTTTGKMLHSLKHGPGQVGHAFAFSPDGRCLATSATADKTIRLWDVPGGAEVRQMQTESGTVALAFSPDGKILAASDSPGNGKDLAYCAIHLWDTSTGKEIRRLKGNARALTFSADGKRLISHDECSMCVWDVATGEDLLPFAEQDAYVPPVVYSPDGRTLAAGAEDGSIRLWESATGQPARRLAGGDHLPFGLVAFSTDGRTLLSSGSDGSVRFWDVTAGREVRKLQVRPPDEGPEELPLYCSPDGRTLAVKHKDGSFVLLDATTGKERCRLPGDAEHDGPLCFSPDGRMLARVSFRFPKGGFSPTDTIQTDGLVQLWDATAGKEIRHWSVAESGSIAFSPDGRTLLMAGIGNPMLWMRRTTQQTFHAWDAATGEDHPFTVRQSANVVAVAFSPDGRTLAWGDSAGAVTLWEVAARQVRRRLAGQQGDIQSLAFSPDGRTLASAARDTTVLVWDATGLHAAASAGPLPAERLWALWDDLADKDAGKAFDAVGLLTAFPAQAVPLLQARLRPAPAAAESPEHLRELRAVEVLEHVGTADARAVLETLAGGAPAARLTREAKASLERMRNKQATGP
jgi:WD40 repeat protein